MSSDKVSEGVSRDEPSDLFSSREKDLERQCINLRASNAELELQLRKTVEDFYGWKAAYDEEVSLRQRYEHDLRNAQERIVDMESEMLTLRDRAREANTRADAFSSAEARARALQSEVERLRENVQRVEQELRIEKEKTATLSTREATSAAAHVPDSHHSANSMSSSTLGVSSSSTDSSSLAAPEDSIVSTSSPVQPSLAKPEETAARLREIYLHGGTQPSTPPESPRSSPNFSSDESEHRIAASTTSSAHPVNQSISSAFDSTQLEEMSLLRIRLQDLENNIQTLEEEKCSLYEQIESSKQVRQELEEKISLLESEKTDYEVRTEGLESELSNICQRLSHREELMESASQEIQTLTEQVGDLQMQKILLRTQRDAFHEKLREAEIEKSSLAGELQIILESQAKSREELQKIQNMSESAREREEYLQRRLLETIRQVEVERAHRSRVETSLGAEKMLRLEETKRISQLEAEMEMLSSKHSSTINALQATRKSNESLIESELEHDRLANSLKKQFQVTKKEMERTLGEKKRLEDELADTVMQLGKLQDLVESQTHRIDSLFDRLNIL